MTATSTSYVLERCDRPRRAAYAATWGNSLTAHCRIANVLAIFRKALGEEHAYTAASYEHLALCLQAQDKHAEAEALFSQALAIHRKVLGEAHADTAASYGNLATSLHAQGRYAEAELSTPPLIASTTRFDI